MKKDLEKILNDWKNEEEFHKQSKFFNIRKNPIVDGEFIIILKRHVVITFLSESTEVKVEERYYTCCQSKKPISKNLKADQTILNHLIKFVDNKFFDYYIKKENELIQKVMPDGFF